MFFFNVIIKPSLFELQVSFVFAISLNETHKEIYTNRMKFKKRSNEIYKLLISKLISNDHIAG